MKIFARSLAFNSHTYTGADGELMEVDVSESGQFVAETFGDALTHLAANQHVINRTTEVVFRIGDISHDVNLGDTGTVVIVASTSASDGAPVTLTYSQTFVCTSVRPRITKAGSSQIEITLQGPSA